MDDITREPDIGGLETALRERARTLADQYLESAHRQRDRIIADETEHLRLREEREILAAKALADRAYRQHVQAAEIKQQEILDKLRWSLVREVLDRLPARVEAFVKDGARYDDFLRRLLARSARAIESDALVATLNARDRARLAPRWQAFAGEAAPAKRIALADTPLDDAGGIVVTSADGAIRIDDSFAGRRERLEAELQRIVVQALFATTEEMRVGVGR